MDDKTLIGDRFSRRGSHVLGTFIDAGDWTSFLQRLLSWAGRREQRTVCLCNVHSAVTAREDNALADALAASDLVLPDGAPIAWTLKRRGFTNQTRIAGPDLMLRLCAELEQADIGVFLFGSSNETLDKLVIRLQQRFPNLHICGALSPQYGIWTEAVENSYIEKINASGAGVIFIGLGCPRQEIWMSARKPDVCGVMLGVGAAFDFHADTIRRAPDWMQRVGLEWLHRLLSEPRRLWKRYLITNTKFLVLTALDVLASHQSRQKRI